MNTSTSNLSKRNYDLSRSTHNLSKTPNKMSVTNSSNLNTPRSRLGNSDMNRSTQNISKSSLKLSLPKSTTTRMNSNLSKSVHNLANNSSLSLSNSTKINRVNSVDISRSVNNLNKISSKFSPAKSTNLIKAKNNEYSKSVQNLNKVSSKIAIAKPLSISPDNIQNISESSLDLTSKSDIFVQSKRDFVNANIKSLTPHIHKENVEAEIEEMKKVIEAKIDQQLKELSFEEIDGQIKGSVKSKVEQYSKNIEEEEEKIKDCFVALKCPKDIEIKDIIEKFSGNSSTENAPVNLNNSSTFNRKISAFSNFVVDDKAMNEPVGKLPPKVTPRTKNSLKKADEKNHFPSKCDEKINSDGKIMISKRNDEVFGVKKHFVDSKYSENIKSLSPLRKNNISKNSLELNLNTRSGSDLSKGISAKEKSLKTWLDNKQFVKRVDCNMNYGSDDSSSDDSGNISTEIENDDCVSPIEEPPGNLLPASKDEVFLRNGVLTQLEAQRDECLGGVVVKLQARCRGYLARRRLSQRKLQDLAVRCIQRNVRKFMLVRDWPWWRLLVRVTPLLNVHRTEEKLKLKTVRRNLTL
ncbi:hypothetical protein WA026_019777 [Henosepilachna vigintioctopunctata]|uniref:Uncharacterized protein n=1 Tax=Henosepilachna vigintioctopunctata TaxID=420089 RepID=A0AAW1VHK3_9CUCU